jgi:hypothetical protein
VFIFTDDSDASPTPFFEMSPMNHLVQAASVAPPKELAFMFADPPLVGDERREDYDHFLTKIAEAVKPADNIIWLLVLDVTNLSWEIRRERKVKADIVRSSQTDVVEKYLRLTDSGGLGAIMSAFDIKSSKARQWFLDPQVRQEVDLLLAQNSYDSGLILAEAFVLGADQIDAVDRRIASYELRRMMVLRQAEQRSEKIARQLDKASKEVMEGEFSEVSEGAA